MFIKKIQTTLTDAVGKIFNSISGLGTIDKEQNAPSISLMESSINASEIPQDTIIAYDGDDIPDGYEVVTKNIHTISNLPTQTVGTNLYTLNSFNNIVSLNVAGIWLSNIAANTWTDLGQLPTSIYPSSEISCCAVILNSSNGNPIGYGRISITNSGSIKVKANVTTSVGTGISFSISWII